MPTQGIHYVVFTSLAPLATLKSQILQKIHMRFISIHSETKKVDVYPYQNKTQKETLQGNSTEIDSYLQLFL